MVLHRVIGKTKVGNTEILKVRGDALMGTPEYISTSQVIGRAIKQWRNSKVVDLQRGIPKFLASIWLITYPVGSFLLCIFVFYCQKISSFYFAFLSGF